MKMKKETTTHTEEIAIMKTMIDIRMLIEGILTKKIVMEKADLDQDPVDVIPLIELIQ